jgi:atrial natriuretic peptide receptor A
VSIDGNGDRNVDYSLLNMDPNSGNYEVVSNYFGVSQQFVDVPNKRIYWAGGLTGPPPDTPVCGFEDEKCADDVASQYAIVSGILSGLLLVLFVVFIIVYRHYKLEAELASMTWKIRFDDIITYSGINNRQGFGSRMSLTRVCVHLICFLVFISHYIPNH